MLFPNPPLKTAKNSGHMKDKHKKALKIGKKKEGWLVTPK